MDLVSEGKSDWYLPAIDELNILMINRFNVNKTLQFIGDQVREHYWSSTENNGDKALVSMFNGNNSNISSDYKFVPNNVRAIRAF